MRCGAVVNALLLGLCVSAALGAGCVDSNERTLAADLADGELEAEVTTAPDATTAPDTEPADMDEVAIPPEVAPETDAEEDTGPDAAACAPACENGGACTVGRCDCTGTGYGGAACQEPVCTGGCLNGSACVYPETCDCGDSGYEGPRCEEAICVDGCGHGKCASPGKCECDPGYEGDRCEEPVCDGGCLNGGTCVAPATCDCDATAFAGPRCELVECSLMPCPVVTGFDVSCNPFARCEYQRSERTEPWQRDDVWIFMRANPFQMGAPEDEPFVNVSETPQHVVTFPEGFFIARYEVTVRLYDACRLAGRCSPAVVTDADVDGWGLNTADNGRTRHPQNGLTWQQAKEVCEYLGGRLPTEAEWEYGATGAPLHQLYPWGDSPEPTCGVHAVFDDAGPGCGSGGTMEIDATLRTAGRSGIGAHDMAGNVWEWVEDCWHKDYVGAPSDGRAWTTDCASEWRVIRGSSYFHPEVRWLRTAYRSSSLPTFRDAFTGVRCARDLVQVP